MKEFNSITDALARWQTGKMRKLKQKIFDCLHSGSALSNIEGLGKTNERWDLRGFHFSTEPTKFVNRVFSNIDFSYARFGNVTFEKCTFDNVRFCYAEGINVIDSTSRFDNCDFANADWRNCHLGKEGASYINCNFTKTKLSYTYFTCGYFVDCLFDKVTFGKNDFNATHFVRCKFKGKLSGLWFRGNYASALHEKLFGKTEMNRMTGVDFSKAVLWDVTFANNIDLATVILPDDGKHFLFKDWPMTSANAQKEIKASWNKKFGDLGLRYLQSIFIDHNSQMSIYNTDFIKHLIVRSDFLENESQTAKFADLFVSLVLKHR